MSLPKLTAFIGRTVPFKNDDEFASLVKGLKKVKEGEEAFIVFLVLDLQEDSIYFELGDKLTEDSVYTYNYFGNNASAGTQYYLSRDTASLKYLLRSTLSDLHMLLDKNDMANGELGTLLKHLADKGYIKLAGKKGLGQLELSRLSKIKDVTDRIFVDEKGNIHVGEKKCNPEDFIRLFIGDTNRKNRFVLVVPKVVLKDGRKIILSIHPDYLELVKRENNLGKSESTGGDARVCHICKEIRADVSSEYSTKFDRSGINKIFAITTVNSAPYFVKKAYDNVYSICNECYKNLRLGEKHITKQFRSKIAGEDVFLLPEGVLRDFDYKYFNTLKTNIDLAFSESDAENWIRTIESEKLESNIDEYAVNFLFYRTDGTSMTILETIEDVPVLRFEKIMRLLSNYSRALKPHINNINIGTIYRLIPVKTNKNNVQLDIGRVLSFYKAIMLGEKISHKVLFDYAADGLEKGLKQLGKNEIDNYFNLGLTRFINGNEDFFIKRLIFGYLVLFKACQDLGVLDKEVFKSNGKVDELMGLSEKQQKGVISRVNGIEAYLEKLGFDDVSRMLFYLGILINLVAVAQVKKGHATKPILKKIQFQGMSKKEIESLYNDVQEKLIQYGLLEGNDKEQIFTYSEYIMKKFHQYYGLSKSNWVLTEQANVFMIMAGYSYNVKGADPNLIGETKEEKK